MAIPSKQIGQPSSTKPALLWQISKQLEALTRVMYSNPTYVTPVIPLPTNCIEFVADTTDDTEFIFSFNTTGPINFTIDWGDGTTHPDSGAGGFYEESHVYAQGNQQYTVRVCFDDISTVTQLDFPGNN